MIRAVCILCGLFVSVCGVAPSASVADVPVPTSRPSQIPMLHPPMPRNVPSSRPSKKSGLSATSRPVTSILATSRPVTSVLTTSRPVVERLPSSQPVLSRPVARGVKRPATQPVQPDVKKLVPRIQPIRPSFPKLAFPFDVRKGIVILQPGVATPQHSEIGGVSWFQVHIAKRGWYLFDTQGKTDPFCRLYNQHFSLVTRNDDSGDNRNCRMFQRLQPGIYYWEVMLFPYKSTSFRLLYRKLSFVRLAQNQNISRYIRESGALQLFQVQVKKTGLYRFGTEGSTDVVCSLLDLSQDTLQFRAVDDDSGPRTNCLLLQVLTPGTYTYLVRAAYFHRKGPFSVRFAPEQEDRLKFYAITFGERMQAKLDSARHRHRYHFHLSQEQRVSFVAQFQRNTPQLLLLDIHANILVDSGYSAHLQGKIAILSRRLPAGEYYLEVRSPGKPYAPYLLWAHQDRDVMISPNAAKLLSAGIPESIDWNAYEYSLFRVSLHAEKYYVIESRHPAAVACFLEDQHGQALMKREVSRAEPGICRIEGFGRQGTFWVRTLLHHKRQKTKRLPDSLMQRGIPERTSHPSDPSDPSDQAPGKIIDPKNTKHRYPERIDVFMPQIPQPSTPQDTKDGWEYSHLKGKELRFVAIKQSVPAKPSVVSSARLLLWNTNPAPQIQFSTWKPIALQLNHVRSVQGLEDSMGVRLDVQRSDLYWFSARPDGVQDCKILDMYLRFLKQAPVFPNGCDIAAYLLRGSYVVRMTLKHQPKIQLEWRTLRAFPSAMTGKQILVGPIRKGNRRRFQMKIAQAGFYHIESRLVSSVTLVTRVFLLRNRQVVAKPHTKSYRVMSYLTEGDYEIDVEVVQGRGAYTLTRRQLHTRTLRLGQARSARLQPKIRKHYYTVNVKQPRNYQWEARGGADIYCRLYSAQGVLLKSSVAHRVQKSCKIEQTVAPGLYLLEIGSAFQDSELYQVTWRAALIKPSNELVLKQIRHGRLTSSRDEHRYSILIQRPGTYVIETRNPPRTNTDPKCYLYKLGRLMRYNDDSGLRFNCKIQQFLLPGRYTLLIKLAWSTRTGPYSVAIYPSGESFPGQSSVRSPRKITIRPNTIASRVPALSGLVLRPGLRTQALVVRQTRVDIYQLRIDYAGRYLIQTDGNLDTKCFLDDHKEQTVAVNEDGGLGANCKIKVRLPSGLYFIRVLARPLGRIGPYGLHVKSE